MTNEEIAKDIIKNSNLDPMNTAIGGFFLDNFKLVDGISKALRQKEIETIERCADIADREMNEHQGIGGDDCSFEVAQTIRNLILVLKPTDKEQPK